MAGMLAWSSGSSIAGEIARLTGGEACAARGQADVLVLAQFASTLRHPIDIDAIGRDAPRSAPVAALHGRSVAGVAQSRP
jgi:hypothetical protein